MIWKRGIYYGSSADPAQDFCGCAMRRRERNEFRKLVEEIGMLMGYEALRT